MSIAPRWHRWIGNPWGQLIIYLLVFLVLGLGLSTFFRWVRGPERPRYTPFNEGDPPLVTPRR